MSKEITRSQAIEIYGASVVDRLEAKPRCRGRSAVMLRDDASQVFGVLVVERNAVDTCDMYFTLIIDDACDPPMRSGNCEFCEDPHCAGSPGSCYENIA